MRKGIIFISFASLLLLITFGCLHFLFRFTPEHNIISLNKGWNVVFRNEQYLNTNLERLSLEVGSTFSKGDTITLNLSEPLTMEPVPFPYLMFKTQFCAYEVYLDNILIDQHYLNALTDNSFIGMGYNFVQLPEDYLGKKLSIKLFVTENDTRADILTPKLGNFDDLFRDVIHSVLFPSFAGIFMIIFGVVFLLISFLFYIKTSGVSSQVICSILSIVVGIWTVTAFDADDFSVASPISTFWGYSAMYLIVPVMYLLIYSLHKRGNNSVVLLLGCSCLGFTILFVLLHFFNVIHINHFQKPFFFTAFIGTVMLVLYDIMDIRYRKQSSSTRILMLGETVLVFTLSFYALNEILMKYIDYRQNIFLYFLVPSGGIFFAITQLLNHFIFMTRSFAQRKEYVSLAQIAYLDNLTNIPNRVSFDKKMAEFDSGNHDFCILSLDLNGLKEVNDNSGHPAGDRLLKSFAECLTDVFDKTGDYFRIGGDEFIVIFPSIKKELLDEMLMTLDAKLLKLDEEDPEANHSVSYGYAFRSETTERDTHSVLMLADQRMYAYKRQYYSHLTNFSGAEQ